MEIGTILIVDELIKKGAEANLYKAQFVGLDVIIKKRVTKKYRHAKIDNRIRFLRTRNEARMLLTATENGINSPKLLGCNLADYTLILEKIEGENIGSLLINSVDSDKDVITNFNDNSIVYFRKIGLQVALMHNLGIIHGDLTPFNIILGNEPFIIDFGLSNIDHNNIEKVATDLLTFESILFAISYSSAEDLFNEFLNGYFVKSRISKQILTSKMEKISVRGRYVPRKLRKKYYN